MTVRPQPVTSKFRRYYHTEIFPFYDGSKLSQSDSSAGSTASLTSILHHENFHESKDALAYDSYDDLSINDDFARFPEESCRRLNGTHPSNFMNKQMKNMRKQNGIIREIFQPSNGAQMHIGDFQSPRHREPLKKSCKRIIARKPDYPGSRVTHINYHDMLSDSKHANTAHRRAASNNNSRSGSKARANPMGNQSHRDDPANARPLRRATAAKKSVNHEQLDKDASIKIPSSPKSEVDYSLVDFTSVSKSEVSKPVKRSVQRSCDDNNPSSVEEVNSISIDDASLATDNHNNNHNDNVDGRQPSRILTAWEDWYLKKEKESRQIHKKERKNRLNEEEKKKELEIAKEKRREMCQKKIKDWLKKKEEERLKDLVKEKEEKKKKEELEFKKDDKLKKSSEKYIAWKLKKTELQKDQEHQEKEKLRKEEEEKSMKQAKAEKAFEKWLDGHRDHQMPVPYSYGISDGKLTSYYDKTSNPPPTYFNPKAWVPVIEMKQ